MRLYSFVNMYLSGIHAGIQTAHVVHTMHRKYELKHKSVRGDRIVESAVLSTKKAVLDEWLDHHKTIIVKNGGNQASLGKLYRELTDYSAELYLPIGKFHEGMADLNGALTAICIIVPASVYTRPQDETLGSTESKLAALLNSYRFAN